MRAEVALATDEGCDVSKQSDELVQEIDEIRDRLAGTIDELVTAVHPKNVLRRGLGNIRSTFVDDTGSVRTETVVPLVAGIAVLVAGAVVVRRLTR